jgi:hypothetical protein
MDFSLLASASKSSLSRERRALSSREKRELTKTLSLAFLSLSLFLSFVRK